MARRWAAVALLAGAAAALVACGSSTSDVTPPAPAAPTAAPLTPAPVVVAPSPTAPVPATAAPTDGRAPTAEGQPRDERTAREQAVAREQSVAREQAVARDGFQDGVAHQRSLDHTANVRARVVEAVIGVLAILLAAAAAFRLGRRTAPAVAAPARTETARGGDDDRPADAHDDAESLRAALLEVADRSPSRAITEQIERLLAEDPDRAVLVTTAIRIREQFAEYEPVLGATLRRGLTDVGVEEDVADGHWFDPRRHEVVDTVVFANPERADLVAETRACGYLDRGRLLRPTRVVLFRSEPGVVTLDADRRAER